MKLLPKVKNLLRPAHRVLMQNPTYKKAYQKGRNYVVEAFGAVESSVKASPPGQFFVNAYENDEIDPNAVLYESFHGSSMACSPKALFKALLADPTKSHLHHYWVIDTAKAIPEEYLEQANITFIERKDEAYPKLLATAGLLVNNSTFPPWYVRREGQKYANTWHGVPLKGMFKQFNDKKAHYANSQRNFLQSSHIFLQNDYTSQNILGTCDVLPLVANKTYEIGTPRVDVTHQSQEVRPERTPQQVQKVLFAPTWRGLIGDTNFDDAIINELLESISATFGVMCEVHVKIHNFVKPRKTKPGITCIPVDATQDANELMADMDVVITDYSSIMIDAMAADIPTILFTYDYLEYKKSRGLSVDLAELPVHICPSVDDVIQALHAPKRPSSFGEAWDTAKALLFGADDGQATDRMIDILFNEESKIPPRCTQHKDILMFFAGGWRKNGITTSALNLFSNLDYDKHNVVLLTDGAGLSDESWELVQTVPPQVLQIHRIGTESFTPEEVEAKSIYYKTNRIKRSYEKMLCQTMTRELRRIVGDLKPTVAIDFSAYRRLWSFLISQADADTKIIIQHNELYSEAVARYGDLFGIFELYRYFDRILCVSEETRQHNFSLLRKYYVSDEQTGTIRNTIDVEKMTIVKEAAKNVIEINGERFFPLGLVPSKKTPTVEIKALNSPSSGKITFVTMGRFSDEKNHAMLLHAFAQVCEKRSDVQLYILGEGPLWNETVKLVKTLKLTETVFLPGFTSMAVNFLNECDCFVLPSKYEGQPMVLLEALALDKAIIATDIPGSRSLLKGGYGHMTPDQDTDAFAQAMLDFCDGKLKFAPFDVAEHNASALNDFYQNCDKS